MNWIAATLLSAALLGCYDLLTKHAVRENAVLPVLFLCNLCSAAIWFGLMGYQTLQPNGLPEFLRVAPMTGAQHLLLLAKSAMIAAAWIATYFAIKNLPVSIASPLRASIPLWTLLGALLILGERPTWIQLLGMGTTLAAFVGLSYAGRGEGIQFQRNKWIGWLMVGILINGLSSLYDKYLLETLGLTTATVQAWFSIYLAAVFLPFALGWKFRWWPRNEFHWRWSIVFLSFSLLLSDFLYFEMLRRPEVLVSLVSSIRRFSTLVAFAGGLLLFGEKNGWAKLPAVMGIVAGIVLTIAG